MEDVERLAAIRAELVHDRVNALLAAQAFLTIANVRLEVLIEAL